MDEEISKVQFALGLAQKSGKLVSGNFAVRKLLMEKNGGVMFLAIDASPDSKEKMHRFAERHGVKVMEFMTTAQIGSAIGKDKRICAVVQDANFINLLKSKINAF